MKQRHVGLACRTEENADRFYGRLLGLKKAEPKTLPAVLSRNFFEIDAELTVLNYADESLHFEIFIGRGAEKPMNPPAHICLEVSGLEAFLERCRAMDVPVIRLPKGESWVTFIQDFDGNLFEIKESSA